MAEVSGNVIGNLSGKLGNLSARTSNGRTVLSARPSSFRVSNDPRSQEIRGCFKTSVDLAKNIISLQALEDFWTKIKPAGMSVFNMLVKMNFDFASKTGPTAQNLLTPEGFGLPVNSASLTADSLTFELDALDTVGVFESEEVNLSINALVVYKNPVDENDLPYRIIKLFKQEEGYDFTQTFSGSFNLDVMQKSIAARYQNNIVYLAVVSKDVSGNIIQCSATYAKET